jgi:hypothetical protein
MPWLNYLMRRSTAADGGTSATDVLSIVPFGMTVIAWLLFGVLRFAMLIRNPYAPSDDARWMDAVAIVGAVLQLSAVVCGVVAVAVSTSKKTSFVALAVAIAGTASIVLFIVNHAHS